MRAALAVDAASELEPWLFNLALPDLPNLFDGVLDLLDLDPASNLVEALLNMLVPVG